MIQINTKLKLMFALVMAVIFAVIYYFHIESIEQKHRAKKVKTIEIYQASESISKNQVLTDAKTFNKVKIPESYVQPGAVTDISIVLNQFAAVDIMKGEQLLKHHFSKDLQVGGGKTAQSFRDAIPEGMYAVTLPVNSLSACSYLIKPGEVVDVCVISGPAVNIVYRELLVVAVDSHFGSDMNRRNYANISLAVTEPQLTEILNYENSGAKFKFLVKN